MQHVGPTPSRRIVTTPRGLTELDVLGSRRRTFVAVTVFDEDGWATDEDMWWSGHDEGLAEHLARRTGMSPADADALASDVMSTWSRRGGPAQASRTTRRFAGGVLGASLAIAGASGLLVWAVGRHRRDAPSVVPRAVEAVRRTGA